MFNGINCETERASLHTLETASLLIFMREMHVGTVLFYAYTSIRGPPCVHMRLQGYRL